MTKPITYEDLLREREQLEILLIQKKNQIRLDLANIKEELRPANQAISFLGKMFKKDKSNPLLSSSVNILIDLVVKRFLLGNAGWVVKFVVPKILKNYTTHLFSRKKNSLWQRIKSAFGKNGHDKYEDVDPEAPPTYRDDMAH